MKYILSLTLLLFTVLGTGFAQDEKSGDELKNEGNAALKAKDYKTALPLFESAIKAWESAGEEVDEATVYNTATCARKLNDDEKSLKYYGLAKAAGYKGDVSTYYSALAYKSLGKEGDMEKELLNGIEKYSTSKYVGHMKKQLATLYVKDANDYFSKGVSILNTRTDANRDSWDAIKEQASGEFDKAIELADKTLKYQATNEAAKTIKTKIPELLK